MTTAPIPEVAADTLGGLICDAKSECMPVPCLSASTLLSTQPPPHDTVVEDVFDRGAVVEIIGPSKTRKSFFAMQLALGMGAGRDACGLHIPKALPILLVNMELTPDDCHRRLYRMGQALEIGTQDIGNRLSILNLRDYQSEAFEIIANAVASKQFFGIIVDPIYPLLTGDESRPETWAPITAIFNRWATECGFVCYIHHDAKGSAGDRDIRDRGAGSGVAGRNAYARMTLTPHKTDPENSVVINFMLRGYAPREALTLTFHGDAFRASAMPAVVQTGADRLARRGVATVTPDQCMEIVAKKPLRANAFLAKLAALGLAEKRARVLRDELLDSDTLHVLKHGFPAVTWYGTQAGIATLRHEIQNPKREGI